MIDHITPKMRRAIYDPCPDGRGFWFLFWSVVWGMLIVMMVGMLQEARAEQFTLSSPICPSGIWVAQRYDKRDSYGIIVARKWRTKCWNGTLTVRYK